MSRQRDRIKKTAKEVGVEIVELTWKPTHRGPSEGDRIGGWQLVTTSGGFLLGYNTDVLIKEIRRYSKQYRFKYSDTLNIDPGWPAISDDIMQILKTFDTITEDPTKYSDSDLRIRNQESH